jgi:muramidase (phage lysozyme)
MTKNKAALVALVATGAGLMMLRKRASDGAMIAATMPPPPVGTPGARVMDASLATLDEIILAFGGAQSVPVAQAPDIPQAIWASLGAALGVPGAASGGAASGIPSGARAVLDLIGAAEAPAGYRQIYGGIPAAQYPPQSITNMSVDQVIAWQTRIRQAPNVASTAAGRYQIIRDTLAGLAREMGAGGWRFDAATQDRLAFRLMQRRGWDKFAAGRMSEDAFANALAREWAALPVVTGSGAGKSYYAGDGLNKSLVTVAEIRDALGSSRGVWA